MLMRFSISNFMSFGYKTNDTGDVIPTEYHLYAGRSEQHRERVVNYKERKVQKYWKLLLTLEPVHEIYGDKIITPKDISIDHFVPWSYVAHDEFWNLHPTTREINSSKSNNLPDWDIYFPKLCHLEYFSYKMMNTNSEVKASFEKCAEEHLNNSDIRRQIYKEDLSFENFSNALEDVVKPVYQSAKNCGFGNWKYTGGVAYV